MKREQKERELSHLNELQLEERVCRLQMSLENRLSSFQALSHFIKTTAEPKLYWLPASGNEETQRRLDASAKEMQGLSEEEKKRVNGEIGRLREGFEEKKKMGVKEEGVKEEKKPVEVKRKVDDRLLDLDADSDMEVEGKSEEKEKVEGKMEEEKEKVEPEAEKKPEEKKEEKVKEEKVEKSEEKKEEKSEEKEEAKNEEKNETKPEENVKEEKVEKKEDKPEEKKEDKPEEKPVEEMKETGKTEEEKESQTDENTLKTPKKGKAPPTSPRKSARLAKKSTGVESPRRSTRAHK